MTYDLDRSRIQLEVSSVQIIPKKSKPSSSSLTTRQVGNNAEKDNQQTDLQMDIHPPPMIGTQEGTLEDQHSISQV